MTQATFFEDPAIHAALATFEQEMSTAPESLVLRCEPPKSFTLRPYQSECVDSIIESWGEFQRVLAVLPTGAGKTVIFSKVTERSLPGRTLILAHREELIEQAVAKIEATTGIVAQVEKAERKAGRNATVVVGSVQTLQGDRLAAWPQDHFARIVVDEAHHALSDTYRRILDHFCTARVLGVTATPFRGDKKNLGTLFQSIAFEVGLIDLIKSGYLAPIKIKSIPLPIDLNGIRTISGDFDMDQVDQALDPILIKAAEAIVREAGDRKILIFLPLRKTSKKFTEILCNLGVKAAHVDGTSENRKEILESFSKGEFQVLCNAMLLTEGYDEPSVDCICILKPTKSQPLYAQMVGRGTRIYPGKKEVLLLDFLWLHEKHSLIRPAHLVAKNAEEAAFITEAIKKKGASGTMDLLDAQDAAEHDREAALKSELARQERKKAKTISIEELALMLHDTDLADWEPTMQWHELPPSDKQTEQLLRWKIDATQIKTRGQASNLLDKLIRRSKCKLATPNQIKWLKRFGITNGDQWGMEKASAFLETKWGSKK
jgi:superfamily II DNA or RNA helicase